MDIEKLRAENIILKQALSQYLKQSDIEKLLNSNSNPSIKPLPPAPEFPPTSEKISKASPTEAKIALFRSLFKGREDVYPERWEWIKANKSGYSPVCANKNNPEICFKPAVKCADCGYLKYEPLTDKIIFEHLSGKKTIGVYALLPDETCWFLAADFDKKTWKDDTKAFLDAAVNMNIPAYIERSRSGNGAHIWIFFNSAISAMLARQLGSAILTQAMEFRHQISLESYDRFFPNQDTMPKGGLGNLIALPMQYQPRQKGNSVFLDNSFEPYEDQWALLSSIQKITENEVRQIVDFRMKKGKILGIKACFTDEEEIDPWIKKIKSTSNDLKEFKDLPEKVKIVIADKIYIEKAGIPHKLLNMIIRLAAFQNPEFYRKQAMRFSTFNIPRIICCADIYTNHIAIPRGLLGELFELLEGLKIQIEMKDERYFGKQTDVEFKGILRENQIDAVEKLLQHDNGILSAATAFGKTAVAIYIIAERKRNTLILTHRRQLLDQWIERLKTFLNIDKEKIGFICGGKSNPTGIIDVAVMQSLYKNSEVIPLIQDYGQIIIDECHHLSAVSFEQIIKNTKAKYILGLTATPVRKDGKHPIIIMQCGRIRYTYDAKKHTAQTGFAHTVIPKFTNYKLNICQETEIEIQYLFDLLVQNTDRNRAIVSDIMTAVENGRSPIVLTERREHLDFFETALSPMIKNLIPLRAGLGKKRRLKLYEQLKSAPENEPRVLLATGKYIGEGFDDARLDKLFLVFPVSWRGTLQQYAGRLHRDYYSKKEVVIYDYVDYQVPALFKMFQRRIRGYKAIGYNIQRDDELRLL